MLLIQPQGHSIEHKRVHSKGVGFWRGYFKRGAFYEGGFRDTLEGTAWNLGEDGGVHPPSAFSLSGKLARLRRSRSGELAFGSRVGISPSARSGGENRELAAESGKVALGNPSMMRRGGIFLGGWGAHKTQRATTRAAYRKNGKSKSSEYPIWA